MGSGWVPAAEMLGETAAEHPVTELPGFHAAAVAGHAGTFRSVVVGERRALVFLGRTHLYEGRGVASVVHGVRTAVAAGARVVVLTNGCGGLRPTYSPGSAGADQRPHQPDRHLADRRPDLRRPHRPLLAAAARAVPRGRARPRGGRLRPVPRPALRDPGRDRHGPRDRRRPGGHVHDAGGDRRPRGRRRGARHLAGDQPRGRHDRRAAQPRGGPRGRAARPRPGWAACSPRWSASCDWRTACPGNDTVTSTAAARTPWTPSASPRPGWPRTPTRTPAPSCRRCSRPATRPALADRFGGTLEFGTAGLRGALGAGPEPDEPGRRHPRRGRPGGVPQGARRHAAVVIGYDARHKSDVFARDTAEVMTGAGLRALRAAPPAAHAGAGVRDPAPRRGAGVMVTASPQPAAGQRLQGLPRRRLADRAAGRRRDLGRDRRGRAAGRRSRAATAGRPSTTRSSRPTWTGSPAWSTRRRPRDLRIVYTPLHGVGRDVVARGLRSAPASTAPAVVARAGRPGPGLPHRRVPQPGGAGRDRPRVRRCRRAPGRHRARQRPGRRPVRRRGPRPASRRAGGCCAATRSARCSPRTCVRRYPRPVRHVRRVHRVLVAARPDRRGARPGLRGDAHRLQVDLPGRRACATATRRRSATASTRPACGTRTASPRRCSWPSWPRR